MQELLLQHLALLARCSRSASLRSSPAIIALMPSASDAISSVPSTFTRPRSSFRSPISPAARR
jgi:hypothetical protein